MDLLEMERVHLMLDLTLAHVFRGVGRVLHTIVCIVHRNVRVNYTH